MCRGETVSALPRRAFLYGLLFLKAFLHTKYKDVGEVCGLPDNSFIKPMITVNYQLEARD